MTRDRDRDGQIARRLPTSVPHLKLTITDGIDPREAERLAAGLRRHLEVEGPYRYFRRSADPSELPQYIQLLGSVAVWLPLVYAAKVFLKAYLETLGKRAGDATCDGLAALFRTDEVKPFSDMVTALADARKAGGGDIEIVVGLDIPDPHFGTAMRITASNAEEIAYALAAFVIRANELSATMKAEMEAGRAPLGPAVVTLEKDGGLTMRWLSHNDLAQHETRIP